MTMFTRFPNCKSFDVRRSSVRTLAVSTKPRLRSPYRCRNCGERFWVISKRAFYLAGVAGIAMVAGAVAWNVVGALDESRHGPKPTAPDAARFAEAVKLAESNDPVAEYRLAHMYASANSVSGNKKQALAWLERAAEHGNIEAQYEFGNALREGFGVVQDYERAAKWLQLAAEHGNADAQYALGQMYRMGIGVPADNAKAYVWLNLAAAQEVAGAAVERTAVLHLLSSGQVLEAQAESRRLSDAPTIQPAIAP
jgi:TPR repeat protein